MKNAELFKNVFGLYATEVWAMKEPVFLLWLNGETAEPCADCISRKAAIDACLKGLNRKEMVANIKALPPVTPAPKMGHWIAQDIHNCHTNFRCSECDYVYDFIHLYGEPTADYTYCPNCGAKMEVDE